MLRGTIKQVRPHREVTLVKSLMKTVITEGCGEKCYGHGKYSARGFVPTPWGRKSFLCRKEPINLAEAGSPEKNGGSAGADRGA